jgi:hypothetical protein
VSRFLGSARGRLLAVIDEGAQAERAVKDLVDAGFERSSIEVYTGERDAEVFDASGRKRGPWGRLLRTVQFTLMDQMPDFGYYEAAVSQGRSVISVKARTEADMRRAVDILRAHGAHFINHFGLFTTEEFERWRGEEPKVPGFMRR